MITRKSTFYLGIFVFLIPFLGLPSVWKTILIIISAFLLIISSVTFTLPKKPIKRIRKKEKAGTTVKDILPPASLSDDQNINPPSETSSL
jgi:hypothetical protein